MARLSQGLLQGLMQPAFGQNLYQVGRAAAAGPAMTSASQRMKEQREQTQRGITGGLFGMEQAVAEGADTQDAIGSLVGLGATPEQIAAAQERGRATKVRTEAETLKGKRDEGVEALTALISIPDFDIDENPKDRRSFLREASFYKISPKEARDIYEAIKPTVKKGTPAKPTIRSIYDPAKKMNIDYAISRDDEGRIVKELIGPTKVDDKDDEGEEVDLGLDTKWGSELLKEAREKGRDAEANARLYDDLATAAGNREFYERGVFGKTLSSVEESFGVAGQVTIHRRRINEIRMSGALELLPTGPASDRDVALALDASIDPNNLSNEDAEAYIRGMAKISRAEAEYYNKKRDFIQETKDPNAVGYDFWVTKEALNRDLKEMEATVPQTMKDFNQKLAQATALQDPQQRQAALSALEQTFPEIVRLLTDIDTAEGQWERFSTGKNLRGFK